MKELDKKYDVITVIVGFSYGASLKVEEPNKSIFVNEFDSQAHESGGFPVDSTFHRPVSATGGGLETPQTPSDII